MDTLLERQRAVLDSTERVKLVKEVQRELITNPDPIWIGSTVERRIASARVHNLRTLPFMSGYDDGANAWVSGRAWVWGPLSRLAASPHA